MLPTCYCFHSRELPELDVTLVCSHLLLLLLFLPCTYPLSELVLNQQLPWWWTGSCPSTDLLPRASRICLNMAPIAFINVSYFLYWRRQIVWYLSLSYRPRALLSFQDQRVTANSMIIYYKALLCLWITFIILLSAVPLLQIFGIRGSLHSIQDKDEQLLCAYSAMLVLSISLPIF